MRKNQIEVGRGNEPAERRNLGTEIKSIINNYQEE
jgi:uncharacterized membrane protein